MQREVKVWTFRSSLSVNIKQSLGMEGLVGRIGFNRLFCVPVNRSFEY